MCSINGFNWKDKKLIKKMNEITAHRGPDASGVYSDELMTLGHQRLSIIDLSEGANQPMVGDAGKIQIVYNGEIYNYKEIRAELRDSYEFKTESDTEVILASYKKWGDDFVKKLNGIFALAIWNPKKAELVLARDFAGVKPLYYFWDGDRFIFSSEIKAILEHDVERRMNHDAFSHYLRVLYVPEPMTMIEGINKVPPATVIKLKGNKLIQKKYWNIDKEEKINMPADSIREKVKEKVKESVRHQLVSDKPLGVYLSGGIDSSVILDAMSEVANKIETFSVGFDVKENEEREKFNKDFNLARMTAEHYKTNHNEVMVKTDEIWPALEDAIWHLDEPVSNPTVIPMIILSRFAKGKVSVVLSGDGGDELFGGYERYRLARAQEKFQKLPRLIRFFLRGERFRKLGIKDPADRLALFMFQKDEEVGRVVQSQYFNKELTFRHFKQLEKGLNYEDTPDFLMKTDRRSWLVDEDLLRADKMSMANGLEVRVPFLDKQLIEFAESISTKHKVSLKNTKIILKEAFGKELPNHLLREPKRGWFSPGAKWLRYDDIYRNVDEVLSPNYYEGTEKLFKWAEIKKMLEGHYTKEEYNLTMLWALITFQMWAKRYKIEIS